MNPAGELKRADEGHDLAGIRTHGSLLAKGVADHEHELMHAHGVENGHGEHQH